MYNTYFVVILPSHNVPGALQVTIKHKGMAHSITHHQKKKKTESKKKKKSIVSCFLPPM